MRPFLDAGQFKDDLSLQSTDIPDFLPSKNGYGVEIKTGKDVLKRGASFFISSGRWCEMKDDGVIDQEVPPSVIGELIDPLSLRPFTDSSERKSPESVLLSGEIIKGQTIDFEGEANKDGRITIFDVRARGYVANEEIPHKTRGVKVEKSSFSGQSTGKSKDSFLDGGESDLGVEKTGFYGNKKIVNDPFTDRQIVNEFNMTIDTGDFNSDTQEGSHGFSLYSSSFKTDSVAFLGLLK